MVAMTAGSSQPTSVPPWNPHKSAAPTPPTGQIAGTSLGSHPPSNNSSNYPDVAADIVDLYDPGSETNEIIANEQTVAPDYPLDSLPRHSNAQSASDQTSHVLGENGMRTNENTSGSRMNSRAHPRTSDNTQSVVPVTSLPSSTSNTIPQSVATTMAPRNIGAGGPLPQVYTVSHLSQTHSQPTVSQSNVSVSVNHSIPVPPGADHRHIRTQDLNVGVVARHDHHRPPASALPDIVTHSQPPQPGRPGQASQRPNVTDPRILNQGHRPADPHSRHSRHHRDNRHSRSRRHSHRHSSDADEPCKASCLKCLAAGTSFRWILVVLSLLGVCCVVTGIVLAALHAAGNSFLFLAIMFIGLGVLLVVVVGVGWKCTPRGHEPLHALFNLGDFRSRRSRRHRSHHRRDGRWYGGVMYPEFQYRRPPPSYNASMQEYQNQLMVAQQNQTSPDLYDPDNIPDEDYSLPSSPPPSYRSRASTVRAGIQITFPPNQGGDFPDSRPPTYRSHPSNTLSGHGRTRPSLSRDDDDDDEIDDADRAPADVAFTGSSVIVDTNTTQNSTSIQIAPSIVSNQNVTVSVTTVSVTSQPVNSQTSQLVNRAPDIQVAPTIMVEASGVGADNNAFVDAVGDVEGDRVETAL